ncbi:MAG: hypothetical protein EBV30_11575 [Actinobacteria bacterium]|nr:hypothetical protein [Actinomycetota bacterium]NBO55304.1 hypothetical protein [Actinomycetota bacterium]
MEVIKIRKYQNRKLYNRTANAYINSEELKQLIREGKDVVITDHKTKNDITAQVLVQLIFETERRAVSRDTVPLLKTVIKTKGTFSGFVTDPPGTA